MPDDNKDATTLLVEQLWRDPQARLLIQRETKRLHPDVPTPELDAAVFTRAMKTELDAAKASREALDAERQRLTLDRERHAAISKHGLAVEDVPAIEALMADPDHPIASHDRAAEIIANRRAIGDIAAPRSGPSPMLIPGVHTPDDKFFATGPSGFGIANHPKGPMGWASERAHEHLTDIWKQNPALRPAGVR